MPVELPSIQSGRPSSRQRCSLRLALLVALAAHLGAAALVSVGVRTMLGWDIIPSLLLGSMLAYVLVSGVTILLCVVGVLLSTRRAARDYRLPAGLPGIDQGRSIVATAGARS
jgi:hypothetical protein